ncbi:GGDEF domain-containing protein [Paenibacillus tarimensis]|uniref:GGDEF domain-containing protein n=1 Tax=Paenibacillus tarimensis TaxID=416012 RepID=UPI001F45FEAA|nr:GGDEF domain-containing protein [Paenibacillus tarimensis]MCF2943116.1 GGDEF domain-containing protein [Paenibacillus tarimensis]
MGEIGFGLLDREMVRRITERWHEGGVGVLYVQLQDATETVLHSLGAWAQEERRIFWHCRMNREYFFFLNRKLGGERLEALLHSTVQELRDRIGCEAGDVVNDMYIGMSKIVPTHTGRSAETLIYNAVKEAWSEAGSLSGHSEPNASPRREMPGQKGTGVEHYASQIGELATIIPVFPLHTRVADAARLFENDPTVLGAVVVDGKRPVGLIMKEKLHQLLAGQFGLPLYWNRSVEKVMDADPLIVEYSTPVEQVSTLAMSRHFTKLYDVVTITRDGEMAGAATIRSILEYITKLRTEAAMTANPLTGLPGGQRIQQEIMHRIDAGKPFSVIYADLDYFKWFNDCFGFRKGDELIRYTADSLQQVVALLGSPGDFIGHIGGDDYIVVTEAEDPEALCSHLIWRFDGGVQSFYGGMEVSCVVDRSGNTVDCEGVTLSLSVMQWDGYQPVTPEMFSELSARLKKQAKRTKGSVYVMEKISDSSMELNGHV